MSQRRGRQQVQQEADDLFRSLTHRSALAQTLREATGWAGRSAKVHTAELATARSLANRQRGN